MGKQFKVITASDNKIMSKRIAFFLILIISIQQIYSNEDFQNLVLKRLENLEEKNRRLEETVKVYKLASQQTLTKMEAMSYEFHEYKENINMTLNGLDDKIETAITTALDEFETKHHLSCSRNEHVNKLLDYVQENGTERSSAWRHSDVEKPIVPGWNI